MTELSSRALAIRIWRDYLKRRWPALAVAMLMAAVGAGLTAALARLLQPATDSIFGKTPTAHVWLIPAAIVVVAMIRLVAQAIQAGLTNRIGHRLVGDIQAQLYGRLLHADLARLRSAHTGGYVSQVLYDTGLIREAATNGVVNYTQHGLTVIAMLGVMVYLDPILTGIVFVSAPALSLVSRNFSRRSRKAAKGAMDETGVLATAMMEGLDGVKIVKIANRESQESDRVAEVIRRRQKHIIKGADARAYSSPATEALMMIVTAAVIGYAGWSAAHPDNLFGGMTGGKFTAFIVALAAASQSLRQLANLQTVMSEGMAGARRLFEALDIEPTIADRAGAVALPDGPSTIRFADVRFVYGSGAPALDGVSLEARRGETIALVGPSGGGKSTALNLIPRFYDATGGGVSIDGHDVRDVTLASLRERIALVTQEPFLFDDTIAANIRYGREDASPEQIEAAARQAAAHEFITDLPQGYDTPVGEAGARLSGGQRQRIAIARAFLKDAPILLLDEATSALDTESEAQVQIALERLMAGRTTVLIAHRLSTVKSADRIYVIDRGKVIETGDHRGLSAAGGLYSRLAKSQDLEALPVETAP